MKNKRFQWCALTCACVTFLSSCGGGEGFDGVAPPPEISISGRLQDGLVADVVCLDTNKNLVCDSNERQVPLNGGKTFAFQVSGNTQGFLLGSHQALSAGDALPSMIFAAPLSEAPVISALSTLQVARMAKGETASEADTSLRTVLRLPTAIHWQDYAKNAENKVEWERVELSAQAALRKGYAQAGALAASDALPVLARALESSLARYMQAGQGTLLPTITTRTIGSETALALNPTSICPIATEVPKLFVDIEDGQTIIEKTDEYAADLYFEGAETHKDGKVFAIETIKGRGNMTWTLPKKPYKLKLDKKLNVLDMPSKNKHWILVANYLDQTLLKNDTAFCMSRQLALDWTPSSRPVEFYLNGSYQGAYSMIEHIRDDAERVNIGSRIGTVEAPHPDDGFFVEMDWRLGEPFYFYTSIGHAYTVKTDSSAAERDMIAQYMADFENRLYDREHPNYIANLAESLDIEAFIDYYLINELMRNFDGYALSTFAYRPTGGKLTFGPVWDFDLSADSNQTESLKSWFLPNKEPTFASPGTNSYMAELLEHPEMRAHTLARMKYLRTQMPQILSFLQQSQLLLDPVRQRDIALWHNADSKTYAQSVHALEDWLEQRSTWMINEMEAGRFR